MNLITELRAELSGRRFREQAARVARIAALAVAAQVTALGTSHLSRQALIGIGVGALEAVYRQFVPVAGWGPLVRALAGRLHLGTVVQAPAAVPPAAPPVTLLPTTPAAPADGAVTPLAPGSRA